MNRLSFQLMFIAGVILCLAGSLAAQQAPAQPGGAPPAARQGGAPAGYQNLQVLPKDMVAAQLGPIMQAFNAALGVECSHCHVYLGRGNPGNRMAADDKPEKKKARAMMLMARELNAKIPGDMGKAADQTARVQCGTCHRGAAIPKWEAPPAPAAAAPAAPAR